MAGSVVCAAAVTDQQRWLAFGMLTTLGMTGGPLNGASNLRDDLRRVPMLAFRSLWRELRSIGALLAVAVLASACAGVPLGGETQQILVWAATWRLVVTESHELVVVSADARTGAGDFAVPPTLNEARAFFLERNGEPVTLVAGPVRPEAAVVEVITIDGQRAETDPVVALGMTWFWVEFAGEVRPAGLLARDPAGNMVDQFTLPPMPGTPPASRDATPPT